MRKNLKKLIAMTFVIATLLAVSAVSAFAAGKAQPSYDVYNLSSDLSAALTCIDDSLQKGELKVDISEYKIPDSQLQSLQQYLVWLFPEHSFFYGLSKVEENSSRKIQTLTFTDKYQNDPRTRIHFDAGVKRALSVVRSDMSDFEKALALHDYIVLNTEYDINHELGDLSHCAYASLACRKCVCSGYAEAYNILLRQCGIESVIVKSEAMEHGWNMVKLDGSWYHADLTWDDPDPDKLGHASHRFFLVSDETISSNQYFPEAHYGWCLYDDQPAPACSSDYSAGGKWWRDTETCVCFDSSNIYYLKKTSDKSSYKHTYSLIRRNRKSGAETSVGTISDDWGGWSGNYAALAKFGGRLYMNDSDGIWCYDIQTGKWSETAYYVGNDYFWGIITHEEGLELQQEASPNDVRRAGYLHSLDRFDDVKKTDWFSKAVNWAFEKGITSGISETMFGPRNSVTNIQMVTFMYAQAGAPYGSAKPGEPWYGASRRWGIDNGYITEDTEPNEPCSGLKVVEMMYRAAGSPKVTGESPFVDADSPAVIWAYQNKITVGDGKGHFNPDTVLDRARAVQFIYSAAQKN